MHKDTVLGNWKIVGFVFLITFIPSFLSDNYPTFLYIVPALIFAWLIYIVKNDSQPTNSKLTISENPRQKAAKKIVKRKMLDMLSDGVLTESEEDQLSKYAKELGLNQASYDEVRTVLFDEKTKPIFSKIRRTKRYSPDDEEALKQIAKNQQVNLKFADNLFALYRQLWEIERTGKYTLTAIDTDIRMSNSEECYFETPSTWKREKHIRKHQGYIGGSIGFRITDGITLRVGRALPVYDEYDSIEPISDGMLYVTNKKIVFVGDKKSTTITFGRFANYELYKDAIQINKTSGPPDIFMVDEDDILLLDALLQVI